jgi:GTP pyrophosphokinase
MILYTTAENEQFFEAISYLAESERARVADAFVFARREHGDQRRQTGELFFTHPVTVASYLADNRLDAATLQAALLHDIAEDTRVSIEEIEAQFGPDVARLVNGVTKLKEVTRGVAARHQLSPEELQQATLGKLLRAMTRDVRTVIVKLYDRLHNMRTIKAMPPHKQREKAEETLSVFAPLANRLGMWEVKSELEALSLEVLDPDAFAAITDELADLAHEQQELFNVVSAQIMECLVNANIDVRGVKLAPENIYTVYQDLRTGHKSYKQIDRTMRLVVLVDDPIACYSALGHLHQLWRAVPNRFDDYISVRRDNLYQSLHTTVMHDSGTPIKIRLRTLEMDEVAQVGVLARWLYAGTPQWSKGIAEPLDLFLGTINDNINSAEPQEMLDSVRGVVQDVFSEQIRVYTPRGETIELPQGATAIDFAYNIHTELGNELQQAYVNEMLYPLNRPLRNGDLVRINRQARAQPQRAWLDEDLGYIATTYARSRARRWFRKLPYHKAVAQGKQLLEHEMDMLGLAGYPHQTIAEAFSFATTEELYHALGRAELLPTVLSTRIMTDTWDKGRSLRLDNVVYDSMGTRHVITHADHRELKLCATCSPRPRDAIIGYVRLDGGVTVHREDCHSLEATRQRLDRVQRRLKLGWGEPGGRQARRFIAHIDVFDRPGLLFEITQLMRDESINIPEICTVRDEGTDELRIVLALECTTPRQMVRILHQTQALVNVKTVRVIPDDEQPRLPASALYRPE